MGVRSESLGEKKEKNIVEVASGDEPGKVEKTSQGNTKKNIRTPGASSWNSGHRTRVASQPEFG